jgi:hypothetical protein
MNALDQAWFELGCVTDDAHSHTLSVEMGHLALECLHEKLHEHANFALRAIPVLGAEGKQRQIANACFSASLDNAFYRLYASHVTRCTRQMTRFGPAPVTIHDDGNMHWNLCNS